jgi:hypothetical protein
VIALAFINKALEVGTPRCTKQSKQPHNLSSPRHRKKGFCKNAFCGSENGRPAGMRYIPIKEQRRFQKRQQMSFMGERFFDL